VQRPHRVRERTSQEREVVFLNEVSSFSEITCPSGERAQPGFFSIFADSRPVAGMSWRVLMPDGCGRCQPDSEAT